MDWANVEGHWTQFKGKIRPQVLNWDDSETDEDMVLNAFPDDLEDVHLTPLAEDFVETWEDDE